MLKFLGENYYLDISELEKQVSYENSALPFYTESGSTEQQISVTRYDTFKSLIEVVLTEREEIDDSLGTGYKRQPKSGSKTYLRYGAFIKK